MWKEYKVLSSAKKNVTSRFGGKANLEKAAVQRLERGSNPTLKTLIKVAHALEVPAAALLQFD